MKDAKISVVVPVYKVEKYLNKCVESIVTQTYENLEILLVDDGSPDGCPQICDMWAEKDKRIKVIHKENGGLSSARNAALDIATGDYVSFVDSDDWIDPDMMETLLVSIEDADVSMCGFYMDYLDTNETVLIKPLNYVVEGTEVFKTFILDEMRPEMCGKLYVTDLFANIRFDTETKYAEDLQMNYHIMKKAKKFVSVDKCMYHYLRRSEGSITASYMTDGRAQGYKLTKYFVENECDSELRELCVWRHIRGMFAILNRLINNNDSYFYDKYFKELVGEVLNYKKEILFGRRFALKYKIAVALMMISPSLYAKVNKAILNS